MKAAFEGRQKQWETAHAEGASEKHASVFPFIIVMRVIIISLASSQQPLRGINCDSDNRRPSGTGSCMARHRSELNQTGFCSLTRARAISQSYNQSTRASSGRKSRGEESPNWKRLQHATQAAKTAAISSHHHNRELVRLCTD